VRRRGDKAVNALSRKARLFLNEWKPGEIKSGWEISNGQLELACELGLLAVAKEFKSQHGASTYEYKRTDKPVRLGAAPKVPRLGPRQKEVLFMLALNELRGKPTVDRHLPNRAMRDTLIRYGFIELVSPGTFSRVWRVAGQARREYLPKAAVDVLILEGTAVERKAMNQARQAANQAVPDRPTYSSDAAHFERQAKACYEAAQVYRRAQGIHRKAVAALKPTKEEAMARVVVHEMNEAPEPSYEEDE